ncbi:MAG: MBL fold metallo-hydrolase [Bacteroidales bacterium]|jgi:phosphoribosyl 1,2-cyclic phosphate phosphodiesterase|nr:MBL fold metallo-hydrolase [Bacteroidales bacterium]OPZ99933.1 MAG: Phosphoribosyl 1,2-cyclic phosphodiesterase [Bacteroidetes bacterium ADurb.Bin416]
MKLTFLGTGTSTGVPQLLCHCPVCQSTDPRDKRLRASILIESDDTHVLVDCGPDFRQQALRAGFHHLDGVILTHEHYDHVGGLDDLRPYCARQNMPLYALPRVLTQLKAAMPYSFNDNPYPGVPLYDVHPVHDEPFNVGNLVVQPLIVKHHRLKVLGLRVGPLAYLTDFNAIDPEELAKVEGVKVLVIDALRTAKHLSHNNLAEALTLVEAIRPETTWLIHMSHEMGLHAQVDATLPAGVGLSWDGLVVEV